MFLLAGRLLLLLAHPGSNLPDGSPHLRRQRGGEGTAAEALRGLHRRGVGEEEGGQGDREVPGVQVRESVSLGKNYYYYLREGSMFARVG